MRLSGAETSDAPKPTNLEKNKVLARGSDSRTVEYEAERTIFNYRVRIYVRGLLPFLPRRAPLLVRVRWWRRAQEGRTRATKCEIKFRCGVVPR